MAIVKINNQAYTYIKEYNNLILCNNGRYNVCFPKNEVEGIFSEQGVRYIPSPLVKVGGHN
jgi:hypothetical protein